MNRGRTLIALLFAALIVLAPSLADARAGGSYRSFGGGGFTSQGSLGSRSFNFNGGQPLQRSFTPRGYPSAPAYGYGAGHPFLGGLAGGFFGSWLGGLLFPHWGMGYGYGASGAFGSIFSWLILFGLIWFAIRWFARGSGFYHSAQTMQMQAGQMQAGGMGLMGAGYGGVVRGAPLAIAGADYHAFETILKTVQDAWSRGDLAAMRTVVTPEMLSYFSEELAENESRGVRNHVAQVELLRGDLRQAWDEGHLQYATCALHWRALDYTVHAGARPGEPEMIVSGDPRQPSEATELWTFARAAGGQWLLSAIQQI